MIVFKYRTRQIKATEVIYLAQLNQLQTESYLFTYYLTYGNLK